MALATPPRQKSAPHRVFPFAKFSMDEILKRPYGPEVPMGCVGKRLWASSPQGWGFGSDVHWMDLTNLNVPSWAELVAGLYRPPDR